MRGEDSKSLKASLTWCGSPPHAWGRQRIFQDLGFGYRFTPTCVGKTSSSPPHKSYVAVHPHMRGEDIRACHRRVAKSGSPPHAWGRHPARADCAWSSRFTPTCVGKTSESPSSVPPSSVHPHMRGEDCRIPKLVSLFYGSPPHAWGRLRYRPHRQSLSRFTPTCVGKTPKLKQSSLSMSGSPPHAWGRQNKSFLSTVSSRFTPTCVGKTLAPLRSSSTAAVHPHMRGEDRHRNEAGT